MRYELIGVTEGGWSKELIKTFPAKEMAMRYAKEHGMIGAADRTYGEEGYDLHDVLTDTTETL